MRAILVLVSLFIFSASAATQENSFEKSFSEFGKKLDQAKAEGKQLGQDAKNQWTEIKSKTERTTNDLAQKTEAKSNDWKTRIQNAATEFGAGVKSAWAKLKGEP